MQIGFGIFTGIVVILAVCSAGCLDAYYDRPSPSVPAPPVPTPSQSPESPTAILSPQEMALQPSDMPDDFFLKDRSVLAFDEIPELNRNLGWWEGYSVEYYRMNPDYDEITRVTQTIDLYPLDNMNKLFSEEKNSLLSQDPDSNRYEIPFPLVGDRSVAVRETRNDGPDNVITYVVIFTEKNVYEKVTMSGTATDYEALRNITRTAAARIH